MSTMHPMTSVNSANSLSGQTVNKKVMIALNTTWNLVNFRSGLIRALQSAGYEVVAVAPPDAYVDQLLELGCRYVPLHMDSNGINPARDLLLLARFIRVLRRERPCALLSYTIKPNIYGSFAARFFGIPVINNIAGLGTVFIRGGWLSYLVKWLYRFALSRSIKIFFQNKDDLYLFVNSRMVKMGVSGLLPGSGIDLIKFSPIPMPTKAPIRFLLIARMLWDKGVGEFVEAARLLKNRGEDAEFCLLGFLDPKNTAAVSQDQMNTWIEEGAVRYLGTSDDVRKEIASAHCIVLPSYREGTPRTLLEAAASARPIVTTDSIGCSDVVDEGVNGYLCKIRNAFDLAEKMRYILLMTNSEREEMGLRGRKKVELQFDEKIVIKKYLEVIKHCAL